jgi:hypothetical protein
MRTPIVSLLLAATLISVAACSSDGDTDATSASTTVAAPEASALITEPAASEPATSVPGAADSTPTDVEEPIAVGDWSPTRPDDCVCSDGSPFELWDRPGDPTKVVLFLEGGGACFSPETCGVLSPIFTRNLTLGEAPRSSGIFDADNPENPVAGYSIVYVPYCTGDVHLGDRVNDYDGAITISHTGFDNASAGLDAVLANYPDVEQLVVAGSSAGSVPAPLFAGLAADALPDAEIISFSDASGAYPDDPELNARVGGQWGVLANVPEWPVNAGVTAEEWGFPRLFVSAGTQHPDITFARFDNAFDGVQSFFSGLLGIDASDLLAMIDSTEAQIEAAGVPVASYIAPGDGHTILGSDDLYDLEVEGVRLVDFFAALVRGEIPDDVRCTACR